MKVSLRQKLIKREQAKFHQQAANNILSINSVYLSGLKEQIEAGYALEIECTEAETEIKSGVGILEIEGSIGNYGWVGGITADDIEYALSSLKEAGVVELLLKIDSGGGAAVEMDKINSVIQKFKSENPEVELTSFIDGMGASAAYSIACNSKKIYANSKITDSRIGSIGARITRLDVSGNNAKEKVDVNIIASGLKKAWGDPSLPMSEEEKSYLEKRVEELSTKFFEWVSESRNMPVDQVKLLEAGVFNNEEALTNGLIDGIIGFDALLAKLNNSAILKAETIPFTLDSINPNMTKELIEEIVGLKVELKNLTEENAQLKNKASDANPLESENATLKNQLKAVLDNKKQEAICAYQSFSGEKLEDTNPILNAINSLESLEEVDATIKKYKTLLNSTGKQPVQAVKELKEEEFDAKALMPKMQLKDGGIN